MKMTLNGPNFLKLFAYLCIFVSSNSFAAQLGNGKVNPTLIRIVPIRPTPEADNVKTTIIFPKPGQLVYQDPIQVQVRLEGFAVGTNSDFERSKEIYNDPNGQSLLVFIDNEHPIEIYQSFVDTLDPNNLYYDLTLTTTVPYQLDDGVHFIRVFPDRSYGESLKGPGCFAAAPFYVGKRENHMDVNLRAPYLTYNEPLETIRYKEDLPILLDFYLKNTQLSRDGYKVKVTIDDVTDRVLTTWVPYYIYGLSKGKHTIRLQLIDEKNQIVPGLFNDIQRTITID